MKRLNKKGFVLVETLVVTAFVVTLFVLVYQNAIPIIGEYEKMVLYDDVESIYASNSYKKMLINHGNLEYIDSYLESNSYLDISDCSNTNYYNNSDYCTKLKEEISVTNEDYVFITKYDISSFRDEVKNNEFFDSGKLSNFKSYINTVSNVDSFYDSSNEEHTEAAKYRLFLTRTVTNSDNSKTVKYVNLGVFFSGKVDADSSVEE